jgi:C-terminal processing protease CtpA/Prc
MTPRPQRSLVVFCVCLSFISSAFGDALGQERGRMKEIAKQVSKEIEKNYYDPTMKGLDWNALLEQTKDRIDKANTVGEMMTSIFVMVDKLKDSHTFFMPPERNVSYKYGFKAKPFAQEVRVYDIKKSGAAERAGLKLGDRILSVNNYPADRNSFDQMMLFMRGLRPVAAMDLNVQTDSDAPRMVHLVPDIKKSSIVEDWVNRDSDIWNLINDEISETEIFHTGMNDGDIGYIEVKEFTSNSSFLDGLADKIKGSKAVILDMRDNPGGAQDTLKSFSGLFEPEQTEMAKIVLRNKTETLTIKPRKPNFSGPLYILIDSHSGSAAEAFARHFQLTKRATVIGDHSPGRLNTARIFSEQYGGDRIVPYAIEISVGRFVFPDGSELERVGVAPDINCVPTGKNLREEHDACYSLAVSEARKALKLPGNVAEQAKKE